jgi:hypothetical protein
MSDSGSRTDGTRDPANVGTNVPHPARMYDYWLGGKDNISQVVRGTPHTVLTGAI